MKPGLTINDHVIGKSHFTNGLLCEDYSLSYHNDHLSVCVISDGHGDRNCFRSGTGAQIACEVAITAAIRFTEAYPQLPESAEPAMAAMEQNIITEWLRLVKADLINRPIIENEIASLESGVQTMYRQGQRTEKAYGCTLVLAMMAQEYWAAFQIGDGVCIAAYEDGVFLRPVPADDEGCVGNHSTSLCNTNAIENFRHYFSTSLPLAVFVSSDGIEESFDESGLNNFCYSVAYWTATKGLDMARSKLREVLPQISEGGSGDDVSLAGIITTDRPIQQPRQSINAVDMRVKASIDKLRICQNNVCTAAEKLSQLDKDMSEIQLRLDKAKAEVMILEAECAQQKALRDNGGFELNAAQANLSKAQESVTKAKAFKQSADNFWQPVYAAVGIHYEGMSFDYDVEDCGGAGSGETEQEVLPNTAADTENAMADDAGMDMARPNLPPGPAEEDIPDGQDEFLLLRENHRGRDSSLFERLFNKKGTTK